MPYLLRCCGKSCTLTTILNMKSTNNTCFLCNHALPDGGWIRDETICKILQQQEKYSEAMKPESLNYTKINPQTIKQFEGICLKTLKDCTDKIRCLHCLPSGHLVSGSGNRIKIWDWKTGVCLKTVEELTEGVGSLQSLPSGKLASGFYEWYHQNLGLQNRRLFEDSSRAY